MSTNELRFEQFLSDIQPDFEEAVRAIHDRLAAGGCAVSLQAAKSGLVVSFTHPATKKVVANFVARKKGPMLRLYADGLAGYADTVAALPERMLDQIAGQAVCRRLLDPAKCNARCPMGYVLTIRGEEHKKCRYNCFLLPINTANAPALLTLVEKELAARAV